MTDGRLVTMETTHCIGRVRLHLLAPILAIVAMLGLSSGTMAQDGYFEIDALNPGLGDPPDRVMRDTPQSTVETLMAATDAADFDAAAHLLDMRDVPAGNQPVSGARLARQLATVIERKVVLDWNRLPDRPDGADATTAANDALAGQPRRSIRIWLLDLDGRPVPLRINRVKPGDGDPVWVFSRETVDNIPPLFARYGPSPLESSLPDVLRERTAIGLMRWEILAIPLVVALAVLTGWLVARIFAMAARRNGNALLGNILSSIRGPAIFAAVTFVVSVCTTSLFVFSGRIDAVLSPLIAIGFVTATLLLVVNAIDAVLDRLVGMQGIDLSKARQDGNRELATKVSAFRRAVIVVVVLVGAGIVITEANVFRSLGLSLLATAGAITLVLAFAARRVLANVMSSLQIAMNGSARIGDRVVYNGYLCHVERINFTFVQLRDWDGTRVVVPVEEFASNTFENWTMQAPEMLRIIKLKFAHGIDVDALRPIFDEAVRDLDRDELGDLDSMAVNVAGQDTFGVEVWFSLPCADPNTSWNMACQAREAILARAAELDHDGRPVFPDVAAGQAA